MPLATRKQAGLVVVSRRADGDEHGEQRARAKAHQRQWLSDLVGWLRGSRDTLACLRSPNPSRGTVYMMPPPAGHDHAQTKY